MDAVAIIARVALATVFAVAVAGKLRVQSELTASLPAFGLPARRWISNAIIACELVTVGFLAVAPLAGFVASAMLLLGFTTGLRRILRSGARASCRCFGRRSSPVSRHHILRNLALVVLAVAGGLSAIAGTTTDPVLDVVSTALGAAVGFGFTRWDDLEAVLRSPAPAAGR